MTSPYRHVRYLPLLAAAGLLVLLSSQNRALRTDFRDTLIAQRSPQAGNWMPLVDTVAINGTPIRIGHSDSPQILIFFNTTCEFCLASLPAWAALNDSLSNEGGAEIIGVSFDDHEATRAYVADHELRFAVTVLAHVRWSALFRIHGVPAVVVLTPEGRVADAWSGTTDRATIGLILDAVRQVPTGVRTPDAVTSEAGEAVSRFPGGKQ